MTEGEVSRILDAVQELKLHLVKLDTQVSSMATDVCEICGKIEGNGKPGLIADLASAAHEIDKLKLWQTTVNRVFGTLVVLVAGELVAGLAWLIWNTVTHLVK